MCRGVVCREADVCPLSNGSNLSYSYVHLHICRALTNDNERRAVLLCKDWSAGRQHARDAFPDAPAEFFNPLVDKRYKVLRKLMSTACVRFIALKDVVIEDGTGTGSDHAPAVTFEAELLSRALSTWLKHPRKRGVPEEDWLASLDYDTQKAVETVQRFRKEAVRVGLMRSVLYLTVFSICKPRRPAM